MSTSSGQGRRRRRLLRVATATIAVLLLLAAGVALLGPRLVASVVSARIAGAIEGSLHARADIDRVRLHWSGPQELKGLEIRDESGATIARMDISLNRSIPALLRDRADLGTISATGDAVLDLDTIASLPRPSSGAPRPLPPNLSLAIDLSNATLAVRKGGALARWRDVQASATLAPDRTLGATLSGQPEHAGDPLSIRLDTGDITDATGVVSPWTTDFWITGDADVPASFIGSGASADPDAPPAHVRINLKAEDGIVFVPDEKRRPYIRFPVPPAALADVEAGLPGVRIEQAPQVQVELYAVSFPLANLRAGGVSMRDVTFDVQGEVSELLASYADEETGTRHEVRIGQTTLELGASMTAAAGINGTAHAPILLDGRDAGGLHFGLRLRGLADEATGMLLPGLPRILGNVSLRDVPAGVLQPLASRFGIDIEEFAGPTLTATVSAENVDEPDLPAGIVPIVMDADISSEFFKLEADMLFSPDDEQELSGNLIQVQSHNATSLLRALLPDGYEIEGDAVGIVSISDFAVGVDGEVRSLFQVRPEALQFENAVGDASIAIGDFDATRAEMPRAVRVSSLSAQLALDEDEAPQLSVDYRVAQQGHPGRIVGTFDLAGLRLQRDAKRVVSVDFSSIEPRGELLVQQFPSDGLSLLSPEVGDALYEGIGDILDGSIALRPDDEEPGAVRVELAGDVGRIEGEARVEDGALVSGEGDIVITIGDPDVIVADLLGVAAPRGAGDAAPSPMVLGVRSLRVPLRNGAEGFALSGVGLDATATGVPVSVVGLADPRLLQALGPRASRRATLDIVASGATPGGASTLEARVRADELIEFHASGQVAREELHLDDVGGRVKVSPATVDNALDAWQVALRPRPKLEGPAWLDIESLLPVAVGLEGGWKPDVLTLRPLRIRLRAENDVVLANVRGLAESDRVTVGLRSLDARLQYSAANAKKNELAIDASVFDPASPGRPAIGTAKFFTDLVPGVRRAVVEVRDLDSAAGDALLGSDGMLVDEFGPVLNAGIDATWNNQLDHLDIQVDVHSERVELSAMVESGDRYTRVARPFTARWSTDSAGLGRILDALGAAGSARAKLEGPLDVTLDVRELSFGAPGRRFDPRLFRCDVRATAPSATIVTDDGRTHAFDGLRAEAVRDEAIGGLRFALAARAAQEGFRSLRVDGRIEGLMDEDGAPSPGDARAWIDAEGEILTVWFDIIDEGQGSGFAWSALLGSSADVTLHAEDLSQTSGSFRASLVSPTANASVDASVSDHVVSISDDFRVELHRVTQEASNEYFSMLLPFLEQFEKTPEDEPAIVTASGLRVPLDGDLSRLDGTLDIDLGTIRFRARRLFARFLDATANNVFGVVGQRIEPFTVTIDKGVATYQDVSIPTGEFTLVTRGSVNLVSSTADFYVMVPLFAVSGEVSSALQHIPGLGRMTMIPFRFTGALDNLNISVDTRELALNLPGNVTRGLFDLVTSPVQLIGNGITNAGRDQSGGATEGVDPAGEGENEPKTGNKNNGNKKGGKKKNGKKKGGKKNTPPQEPGTGTGGGGLVLR